MPQHVDVPRSAVQVRVDVQARPVSLSCQRGVAGTRVRPPIVRGEEEHAGVVVEGVLGGVPVVVVPVDDQDPLEPVDLLRVPRRDGRVAVEAEALFPTGVVGMVAGGPGGAEGVLHGTGRHGVHGSERTRDDELGHRPRHFDAADRRHVLRRVMTPDVRHGIREKRQRHRLLIQPALAEDLHHPDQAEGALGMRLTPPRGENVFEVAGVIDQTGSAGRLVSGGPRRCETLERADPQESPRRAGDEVPTRPHVLSHRRSCAAHPLSPSIAAFACRSPPLPCTDSHGSPAPPCARG